MTERSAAEGNLRWQRSLDDLNLLIRTVQPMGFRHISTPAYGETGPSSKDYIVGSYHAKRRTLRLNFVVESTNDWFSRKCPSLNNGGGYATYHDKNY